MIKKLELRGALEAAYDHGDRLALRELAVTTIPAAMAALSELDAAFRRNWLACAKAQGLERIQIRNAGQMARLEELCDELHYNFCAQGVGAEMDVLFESTMRGGMMYGYTGNYIRVKAPYRRDLINKICRVRLTEICDDHDVMAEILE